MSGTLDNLAYRVRKLETDEPPVVFPVLLDGNLSTPPTQAELDALFGNASDLRNGWGGVAYNPVAVEVYLCVSVADVWWLEQLTQA